MNKKCKDCIFNSGVWVCIRNPYLKVNDDTDACEDDFIQRPSDKMPNCEGWINIYRYDKFIQAGVEIFPTKDEAIKNIEDGYYIDTVKIEWRD